MQTLRFRDLKTPAHRGHVAITRVKPGSSTEAHTHDFFEVFLIVDGRGSHCVNGRKVPLKTGHLAVVRPEDVHWFATTGRESLALLNVAVARSWWRAFHALMGKSEGWERQGDPAGHRLLTSRELLQLHPLLQHLGETELDLATAWQRIAGLFQNRSSLSRSAAPPPWLEAWRREVFALSERLEEPIGCWQKRCGRSPEHLARSCRAHYGLTPGELLNRARIERAKLLLRTTDEKVITVAFSCGFSNLANFHRHFLRATGTTPRLWRNVAATTVPLEN